MNLRVSQEVFRSSFKVIDKEALRWFPGHMEKGMKQMQHKLRSVDCLIEVHDARVPLTGRNSDFKYKISGVKPHILVLNKVDLIDKSYMSKIKESLSNEFQHVLFTNCKDQKCRGVAKLFPLAQELINNSNRYNRTVEEDFNLMIIGIPNVGKSSLVNALRNKHLQKGNASHVGAVPGITRSVLTRIKLSEKPLFYMLDTPGILTPKIPHIEVGLKLALCATLQDHLVGETTLADFLLYLLNKFEQFKYVNFFKLEKPTDNILDVLTEISKVHKKMMRIRNANNEYILRPDFENAARAMLKAFRTGELGKIVLDQDLIK